MLEREKRDNTAPLSLFRPLTTASRPDIYTLSTLQVGPGQTRASTDARAVPCNARSRRKDSLPVLRITVASICLLPRNAAATGTHDDVQQAPPRSMGRTAMVAQCLTSLVQGSSACSQGNTVAASLKREVDGPLSH